MKLPPQALRYIRIALPIAVILFFLVWRVFLTPDALFVILFLVFVTYGLAWEFLRLFSPFLVLLLSYDGLRGFAPYVTKHVHFTTMINFDNWVGHGTIPTVRLQQLLYHGYLQWYDFYFYGLYMMHFVFPVLAGVLVWRTRSLKDYWTYVWSLVALSYAGFLTYIAFPAAPPWMASENGYIPHIEKLSTDIWWAFGVHNFPSLYAKFEPNPVAAVPSLHAAYPTLVALTIWRLYGKKWGLLAFIYPVSVWIGIVYMGEHYVFDALLGIGYAVGMFIAIPHIVNAVSRWRSRRHQPVASPVPPKPARAR